MRLIFLTILFISLPFYFYAQDPEPVSPVYSKVILNDFQWDNASIVTDKDSEYYFALWQNHNTNLDIGVFEENINDTLNSDLSQKILFYDDQLNPIGNCLEVGSQSFSDTYRKKLIMAGNTNGQSWFSLKSKIDYVDNNFVSEPSPSYVPSNQAWNTSVFGYNPSTQELNVDLLSQDGVAFGGNYHPFPGFQNAASTIGVGDQATANKFDIVKAYDGRLVAASEYAGNHTINGVHYDTHVPNTQINKYGFFQIFIDPSINQTVVHPVLSNGGEMVFKRLFPDDDEHAGYRIMVVRGDSVKLGWNESSLVLDNDSLYRILLIKDNYETNQIEWFRQLYGYNNAAKDSTIPNGAQAFTVNAGVSSLFEIDGNIFFK